MVNFEALQPSARTHVQELKHGMRALEQDWTATASLASCRHAARALKTMARDAGQYVSADLVSTMEDFFLAAQFGYIEFRSEQVEFMSRLLNMFDELTRGDGESCGSRAGQRDHPGQDAADAKKRVLVVDDSLAIRELASRLLSARGYAVATAVDGLDGWNTVQAGVFDLLVADEDMPLVGGVRLLRLVRCEPRLRVLPVIMAFDYDSEAAKRRAFAADADYYIAKSKLRDELAQTVASLIGGAQT